MPSVRRRRDAQLDVLLHLRPVDRGAPAACGRCTPWRVRCRSARCPELSFDTRCCRPRSSFSGKMNDPASSSRSSPRATYPESTTALIPRTGATGAWKIHRFTDTAALSKASRYECATVLEPLGEGQDRWVLSMPELLSMILRLFSLMSRGILGRRRVRFVEVRPRSRASVDEPVSELSNARGAPYDVQRTRVPTPRL